MYTTLLLLSTFLIACDKDATDDTGAAPDDTASQEETSQPEDTSPQDTSPKDTGPVAPIDLDGDGYTNDVDCDDANAAIHPEATEYCNDTDNDCDGEIDEEAVDMRTWLADADGDGFGDEEDVVTSCDEISGRISDGGDCDDTAPEIHPDALETCNGVDDDCDGDTDGVGAVDASIWYTDADADGHGNPSLAQAACTAPSGTVGNGNDCDDTSAAIHPDALESCNGTDDNCDGNIDEGETSDGSIFYLDADGDGHGDAAHPQAACSLANGYSSNNTDCDDTQATVFPGAPEYCNGVDDDCDTSIDENDAVDVATWYADTDGDGFGDPGSTTLSCSAPGGTSGQPTDCDDTNASIYLGAPETCDLLDNDCDGSTDEGVTSLFYQDADNDGYGDPSDSVSACSAPSNYLADNTDCDDTNAAWNQDDLDGDNASTCDGDCNDNDATANLDDADNDSFSSCDGDCDDNNAALNLSDADADGLSSCDGDCDDTNSDLNHDDTDYDGTSSCNGDCDDNDATLNLDDADTDGVTTCDGDCDDTNAALNLDDLDGDGATTCDLDCDDNDATLNVITNDADCDGSLTASDCDDTEAAIYPGATSICDGLVNDCGGVLDSDGDGLEDGCAGWDICGGINRACASENRGPITCWGGWSTNEAVSWTEVADLGCNGYTGCAIDPSGTLDCWGMVSPPSSGTYTSVGVGYQHACGLDAAGTITCWGSDTDGSVNNTPTTSGHHNLVVGNGHACALNSTNHATCWGNNSYNRVSDTPNSTFVLLSAGWQNTCGLDSSGTIDCWGDSRQAQSSPPAGSGYTSLGGGQDFHCATDTAGTIECWGSSVIGVPPSGSGYTALSGGYAHACAVDSTNSIQCWGSDSNGVVSNAP